MRESFIQGHHGVAVFYDLEKAYDTTWKYGIMKDLHSAGIKPAKSFNINYRVLDRTTIICGKALLLICVLHCCCCA